MIRVSSTEFNNETALYQDMALDQAVVVTSDGRDQTVLISAHEYGRLKRRDRQVFATSDLPAEVFEAVRHTEMDHRHRSLDELVKDWTP